MQEIQEQTETRKPSDYAPFWSRVLAQNLDLAVLLAPAYLLSWLISDNVFFYSSMLIVYLIYHIICEMSSWRGSVGKRVLKLEVRAEDSDINPLKRTLIRNFLKILSISLLFYGFLMASFDRRRQTLHDKISRSIVVFPLQ